MDGYTFFGALFLLVIGFMFGWFYSKIHYEKKAKKAVKP
jgi:hypothetical protein